MQAKLPRYNKKQSYEGDLYIALSDYIKKAGREQINGLMMQLKKLEKQEQTKYKPSSW